MQRPVQVVSHDLDQKKKKKERKIGIAFYIFVDVSLSYFI